MLPLEFHSQLTVCLINRTRELSQVLTRLESRVEFSDCFAQRVVELVQAFVLSGLVHFAEEGGVDLLFLEGCLLFCCFD